MMRAALVLLLAGFAAGNNSNKAAANLGKLGELAKGLGIDPGNILKGFTDDLAKNFNLVDLFPELKAILGSDPFGLLPVDAIKSNDQIQNTKTLFRAPLAAEAEASAEVSAGEGAAARVEECSAKLKDAAAAFRTKYLRIGGAAITSHTNRHLYSAAVSECKRLPATSKQRHRANEHQFNLGLGSGISQVTGAARDLDLPLSSSRAPADQTTAFLDEVFEKKTGGKVDDFGKALTNDARAICRDMTDAELPVSECEERATALCDRAEALAKVTEESAFTTRQEVSEEAKKHGLSGPAEKRSATRNEAGKNCRCAGGTIRASVAKAGRDRLGDKCLAKLRTDLMADQSPSEPPSLAAEFFMAQSADVEVSYESLLTPDKLKVSNLAGKVLPKNGLDKIAGLAKGLLEKLGTKTSGST